MATRKRYRRLSISGPTPCQQIGDNGQTEVGVGHLEAPPLSPENPDIFPKVDEAIIA
ncbi:hypothetical protein F0726_02422 [Acidithiobacillus caldus]|nr:hypothetical protein F0726_02422 [Acidithiobacillus caldus]